MKLIDHIIAIFSPMMRSTLELGTLNEIWGKFNDKELTPDETINAILSYRWKYHKSKVILLIEFCRLIHD